MQLYNVLCHDVLLLDSPLNIPCKPMSKHWKSLWRWNDGTSFCMICVLSDYQDSSAVVSLFVEYESNLLPHLPFPLHSSDQCLVFALQPRSKSHRAFYSKVRHEANDLWQSFRLKIHMDHLSMALCQSVSLSTLLHESSLGFYYNKCLLI